jgi:membrane fusion protein, multidrug efflux system
MQIRITLLVLVAAIGCKPAAGPSTMELPPLAVPVALPLERTIVDVEEYTGKIMSVDRVNVMARVDGYLAEILIKPGELVKKGDLLFVIDRRPYQATYDVAQGQLQQAEARVARLTKDMKRIDQLMQKNAGTEEDYDKVTGDLAEARAAVAMAKATVDQAKLNLDFAEVRAPISGRVGRQLITVGNLVQGATMPSQASVLTDLVSVDQVYVYFDAPERDVLRYRRSMLADRPANAKPKLEVDVGLFDEMDYPHKGVVDFVAEKLEAGTGTQSFRAIVPNPKRGLLAEGMFARVRIAFSKPYPGLIIAERAVVTVQGNKYLYVINDQDVVEERAVELGKVVAPGLRHVKAGLKPTDRVAIGNLQRLMPGAKVAPSVSPMPVPPGTETPTT